MVVPSPKFVLFIKISFELEVDCVVSHSGANEVFQSGLIDSVALTDLDVSHGFTFEAGIEEAVRIFQRSALKEGEL